MEHYNVDVEPLVRAKRERRRALAKLPIEEKVRILLELQRLASPILTARGLKKTPWKIGVGA